MSSKSQSNISEAEKERKKIMSEFYLSELSKDEIDDDETGLKTDSSKINLKKGSKGKSNQGGNPYGKSSGKTTSKT